MGLHKVLCLVGYGLVIWIILFQVPVGSPARYTRIGGDSGVSWFAGPSAYILDNVISRSAGHIGAKFPFHSLIFTYIL